MHPLWDQTEQTLTSGSGIGSDTIYNNPAQPCRYYLFWAQGSLKALKHVYLVERNPYFSSLSDVECDTYEGWILFDLKEKSIDRANMAWDELFKGWV